MGIRDTISKWTNKKTPVSKTDAAKWMEKIELAKKVKENWRTKFRVALAYEYLEGNQRPDYVNERDWMTINRIYASLRAILPTLYRTDPYFYIKLKKSFHPDAMMVALYEAKAEARQSMLNYLKPEINLKTKIRLGILDAMFQFAVVKSHADGDLVENPDAGQAMTDDEGNLLLDDMGATLNEPDLIPVDEEFKVTRIHPDDFLVDEDAGPLEEDCHWMAQRIKLHVNKVRKNPRFDKKARELVQPTEISDEAEKQRQARQKGSLLRKEEDKEAEFVVTWELYNLDDNQWLTLAEGFDDFLIKPAPVPKGIKKHPFSFLRFFLRDSSFYPIPPVSQWIDPQREYSELRSKIMSHRKRFNRKYVVAAQGLLSPDPAEEIAKLETGADGTVIVSQGMNAAGIVVPIQDAPLDQGHYQEVLLITKDFEELAIGPNQRMSTQGVDSATEAGIIEKRAQIQEGDDISQVADFTTEIARKLDLQIQVHMTRDQVIKVAGPDGEEAWQLIQATAYEEIEGEYSYGVNTSQMTPQTPEVERAQFTALMQLFMNAPALGTDKRIVKFMAGLYNADDSVVDGVMTVCAAIVRGQMPAPGQMGSAPGSPGLPGTASAGMANGMMNFVGGGVK
jgi:hypothetical protein